MFRKMRRFKQELSKEEAEQILKDASHGVLAVIGDEGYPYTVPVSHVYENGKIYFHCATEGHKIDAIRKNDKVSFCVVAKDEIVPKDRTTKFISVIAFGRAKIVDDPENVKRISTLVGDKFSHDYPKECEEEIDEDIKRKRLFCVEIDVEHLTGKAAIEIIKERSENSRTAV